MPERRRLLALTQGADVPSTRFRFRQYRSHLVAAGFDVNERTARFGAYPPHSRVQRPLWLAATLADSLARVSRSAASDLCFLQRNLVATLVSWEPLIRAPLVFDVDDAIFVGQRRRSADRISRRCRLVICGNQFLADYFSSLAPVALLPTAVDATVFVPTTGGPDFDRPVIGWSGTSGGFGYLYEIEPALREVLERHPRAMLKIVADRPPRFSSLPAERVIYRRWAAATELRNLQSFTIGVMPLTDDPVGRGKCSFKMLTYMAVGIPYVVSPVGMNAEVVEKGPAGFGARRRDDWIDALSSLLSDPDRSVAMGRTGRSIIEAEYAVDVVGPRLAALLRGVAG